MFQEKWDVFVKEFLWVANVTFNVYRLTDYALNFVLFVFLILILITSLWNAASYSSNYY